MASDNVRDSTGARDKATRLFTYLRELTRLRTKVVTDIQEYEQTVWLNDIPHEKECKCVAWGPAADDSAAPEAWIEIKKPRRKEPPKLPNELTDWISSKELQESSQVPVLRERITVTIPSPDGGEEQTRAKLLSDSPELANQWERYLSEQWRVWAEEDQRLLKVETIYKDLFAIYQKQQKLGESYEAILGLGFFTWKKPNSSHPIRRHILSTRVTLSFETQRGIISVGPPSDGTKLELEQEMVDPQDRPAPELLNALEAQAAETGEELWDRVRVPNILKSWINSISSDSRYAEDLAMQGGVDEIPRLHFAPAIILRKQTELSFIRLYQEIIEHLKGVAEVPLGVTRLVEIMDDKPVSGSSSEHEFDREDSVSATAGEIYFPLPANREQKSIAQRLESHQGVLVQGPPGTGKSHTIANLVCHLLATGNRVLVTSHTPRALKVLKEKFPPEISALCVSLLGGKLSFKSC